MLVPLGVRLASIASKTAAAEQKMNLSVFDNILNIAIKFLVIYDQIQQTRIVGIRTYLRFRWKSDLPKLINSIPSHGGLSTQDDEIWLILIHLFHFSRLLSN